MIAPKLVRSTALAWPLLGALAACSSDPAPPLTPKESATLGVKAYINGELGMLAAAASRLHDAAPTPDDDGWNVIDDRAAVDKMRSIWMETRESYERVEGAIAELFSDLDGYIDERYDGFVEQNGPDDNLFDDDNVTGMHAVERILWADSQPAYVVAFESAIAGYKPAAFPATRQEAQDFRDKLTARLARETAMLHDSYSSKQVALDPDSAFAGVVGSMKEQFEKLNNAATAADESRYSQKTLEDMRANLVGGRAIYGEFRTWVQESASADVDSRVLAGFDRIDHAYAALQGDALPEVPKNFDSTDPSQDDLATPYGQLWQLLTDEGDGTRKGSLVNSMIDAGSAMGIRL